MAPSAAANTKTRNRSVGRMGGWRVARAGGKRTEAPNKGSRRRKDSERLGPRTDQRLSLSQLRSSAALPFYRRATASDGSVIIWSSTLLLYTTCQFWWAARRAEYGRRRARVLPVCVRPVTPRPGQGASARAARRRSARGAAPARRLQRRPPCAPPSTPPAPVAAPRRPQTRRAARGRVRRKL